ncbi:MAG: PEP-CTERM sorting domain-containing protein [Desulfobacterales bacterium]|nr:PEP-CTERM sorting domain-containing protein [Desulfobacterales bacterium]
MKSKLLILLCTIALAIGIFSINPVSAAPVPYDIGHITDFLDDDTYFNDYEHLDNIDFSGTWNYTVIGYESSHRNWIHDGTGITYMGYTFPLTTFSTSSTSTFGTFDTVNFDTDNLYFQDTNGPYGVALDYYVHNNFFEVFRLTEASENLDYLATPITLPEGAIIVGFNDNGFSPRIGDADFDDIIVALTPGEDAAISPIPEPGTMLLLGCGLMGLAGMGRRRFTQE